MKFHLNPEIFDMVKNGMKNVEGRLNDEKRQLLKVGDIIIFLKRPFDDEIIKAKVIQLDYFNDFEQMVKHYPIERLYLKGSSKDDYLKIINEIYSKEDQKVGVVAISFKKV